MHDHSRFQRDIDDVTGVSLSLSLYYSQKSLTHNIGSASALPIIIKIIKKKISRRAARYTYPQTDHFDILTFPKLQFVTSCRS